MAEEKTYSCAELCKLSKRINAFSYLKNKILVELIFSDGEKPDDLEAFVNGLLEGFDESFRMELKATADILRVRKAFIDVRHQEDVPNDEKLKVYYRAIDSLVALGDAQNRLNHEFASVLKKAQKSGIELGSSIRHYAPAFGCDFENEEDRKSRLEIEECNDIARKSTDERYGVASSMSIRKRNHSLKNLSRKSPRIAAANRVLCSIIAVKIFAPDIYKSDFSRFVDEFDRLFNIEIDATSVAIKARDYFVHYTSRRIAANTDSEKIDMYLQRESGKVQEAHNVMQKARGDVNAFADAVAKFVIEHKIDLADRIVVDVDNLHERDNFMSSCKDILDFI